MPLARSTLSLPGRATPCQVGIELLERTGGDAVLHAAGLPGGIVDVDPGVARQPLGEAIPLTRRLGDSPLRREVNIVADDLDKARLR